MSKSYYAITSFDFGGYGVATHFSPLITEFWIEDIDNDRKEAAIAAGEQFITEVTPLKAKQVVMTNGRKAKLFKVGNEIWARYKDGSAERNYVAKEVYKG